MCDDIKNLIEQIDNDLANRKPTDDVWEELLKRRRMLVDMQILHEKSEQESRKIEYNHIDERERTYSENQKARENAKKHVDPNTIISAAAALLQVTAVAIVSFVTRLDKDSLRFINKP